MEIMKLHAQIVLPAVPIPLKMQAIVQQQKVLACVESTSMDLMITRNALLVLVDELPTVPDKPV
jgi:hypothetical protein